MQSSKGIKFFIFFIINMILILLPNGVYSMQKNQKIPSEVIIGGDLLHMELNTEKIMLFGVEKNSLLKNYDSIDCISGDVVERVFKQKSKNIISKQDMISIIISMKENEKINLTLIRNNNKINAKVDKNQLKSECLVDKIPYTATLTYINPYNLEFRAVGHNIEFEENESLIENKGKIYKSNLSYIKKSSKKYVGNISGNKNKNSLGEISSIGNHSVKGNITSINFNNYKNVYKVADEDDIKLGEAFIVMKHNENKENYYKINITKINKKASSIENFDFKIQDKELLEKYGGIVQGMSGSPIIQDNKLIGALSYVMTKNTSNGVGVYIKTMMKD
ncbi:SpoIVB peptidase S55 domain-containing protein [Paraclostridium ghonii]|uniref:SpoIVB peptidase S55 domain-containing protein n=1 Tax=Paraclostridium ghonii TaxID=29358 RepID=UPI00202CD461|nr:SpoIVB peptidase S55 domain-containing protein [Paeniclostridium ghonii]